MIMLIANSLGVTLSPRLADGHSEPAYSKKIGPVMVPAPNGDIPNGIKDGIFYATGYCKNCSSLPSSKINLQETKQSFVYAIGAMVYDPDSDALDAPLRQHSHYGYFTMDMTKAIGDGVPTLGKAMTEGNGILGSDHTSREYKSGGHAFVMILAFLVTFPFGIIMMRVFGRAKLHMIFQSIGMLLVLVGFISGLVISKYYNRVSWNASSLVFIAITNTLLIVQEGKFCSPDYRHPRLRRPPRPVGPRLPSSPQLYENSTTFGLGNKAAHSFPRPYSTFCWFG
jgi:hypothetical protein